MTAERARLVRDGGEAPPLRTRRLRVSAAGFPLLDTVVADLAA